MAYDQGFAQRVRELLAGQSGITERAMFGGLAFMVDGHMSVVVSGRDLMMVRADDDTADRLLALPGAEQTVMRGRPMTGWVDLDSTVTEDEDRLREVVADAVAHARTLPPKG